MSSLHAGGPFPTDQPAEFRCETCGSRCTRGPDGTEYGHKYRCPERPDKLPDGGGLGGNSYYREGGRRA